MVRLLVIVQKILMDLRGLPAVRMCRGLLKRKIRHLKWRRSHLKYYNTSCLILWSRITAFFLSTFGIFLFFVAHALFTPIGQARQLGCLFQQWAVQIFPIRKALMFWRNGLELRLRWIDILPPHYLEGIYKNTSVIIAIRNVDHDSVLIPKCDVHDFQQPKKIYGFVTKWFESNCSTYCPAGSGAKWHECDPSSIFRQIKIDDTYNCELVRIAPRFARSWRSS